ncbi:hypothetical protein DXH95_10360 [Sphingorhabdus pulchriflava]|uniref:Uncharacterized protein n=1 Tax=Sphingorhabdus pulchriflava TaxID=2292257 RepID=A0A371BJE1_9SPHN|nr:hypothetical protein [Sphingorhabdus pulchriflava]RDV07699.1 hypothetical protein DXH95_10360 [Sphingorhabdus pulchriflava]
MRFAVMIVPFAILMAASAQAENEAPPKSYTDLMACRSIEDASARLVCFDKSSADLDKAREAKEVVLLDRADVRKTRRSLFGFTLPNLPFFDGDDSADEEEIKEIKTTFETVRDLGLGKWQFTIPEGGTWQSTEALTSVPREGQAILIKKGIAGGYMLKIGNGPLRRVKRVN